MLREAVELARQGRAVYVIGLDHRHALLLEDLTIDMVGGIREVKELGIKFEAENYMDCFNWERLRVEGSHPNCTFLVDHHVIECKFVKILEMLHRYDP